MMMLLLMEIVASMPRGRSLSMPLFMTENRTMFPEEEQDHISP
jgi:hypothetical protein